MTKDQGPRTSDKFGLSYDAWGRLVLIDGEGRRHAGVEPVRAFPITDPNRWVSLCDADGSEVAWVVDLEDLEPPIRRILEEELARREFVPVVRRIVRVSGDAVPADWNVETDRGPTRFTLDSEEGLRRLSPE